MSIVYAQKIPYYSSTRGYQNTVMVILEHLSFEEQMKLIHCTDVLIGVQGAGLQW